MASGIYAITHITSGKQYIGSSRDMAARWRQHRRWLNAGRHHSWHLQHAWTRYGADAFTFSIVEEVPASLLQEREQYWIDQRGTADRARGYNISPSAGSQRGLIMRPESRQRLRESHLGNALSHEVRTKLSRHWQGRVFSDEHRARISASKQGHEVTPETRAKLRVANTGHTYPADVYAGRMKTVIVTDPAGVEHVVHGVKRFCREHGLDTSTLMRVAKGEQRHHKGWTARFPD